jgi:hypothetical protein
MGDAGLMPAWEYKRLYEEECRKSELYRRKFEVLWRMTLEHADDADAIAVCRSVEELEEVPWAREDR